MRSKLLMMSVVLFFLVALSACGSYYKVTDPTTGNIYYSSDIKQQKGGAIVLKDSNTGNTVTLQTSEVSEINKEEYKANTTKN